MSRIPAKIPDEINFRSTDTPPIRAQKLELLRKWVSNQIELLSTPDESDPFGTAAYKDFSDDGTFASPTDDDLPTSLAVATYVAAQIATVGAVVGTFVLQGVIDCSASPNYPAASKGDAYIASVAGKIGGAAGTAVDVGDTFIALADNAGGTQAAVGASWFILEHNRASATAAEIQAGTAGKVVEADKLHDAHLPQTLVDAATTAWDMSLGFNAEWTIGGNRTVTFSNYKKGLTYILAVTQDATGGRTITWPASVNWGAAGTPGLSTVAGKTDIFTFYCRDSATPKFRGVISRDG